MSLSLSSVFPQAVFVATVKNVNGPGQKAGTFTQKCSASTCPLVSAWLCSLEGSKCSLRSALEPHCSIPPRQDSTVLAIHYSLLNCPPFLILESSLQLSSGINTKDHISSITVCACVVHALSKCKKCVALTCVLSSYQFTIGLWSPEE